MIRHKAEIISMHKIKHAYTFTGFQDCEAVDGVTWPTPISTTLTSSGGVVHCFPQMHFI